jgi:hypothetical protein
MIQPTPLPERIAELERDLARANLTTSRALWRVRDLLDIIREASMYTLQEPEIIPVSYGFLGIKTRYRVLVDDEEVAVMRTINGALAIGLRRIMRNQAATLRERLDRLGESMLEKTDA